MNWSLLLPLLITTAAGILGWFAAHRLAAARDRTNKRREQRVQYLVEAYRRLAKTANHPQLHEIASELETAVSDIQLFGSPEQIDCVRRFVFEMADNKTASLDELLNLLRDDLRYELDLPRIGSRFFWIRVSKSGSE